MRIGGIETGGTKFICGLADETGNVLEQTTIPTEDPETTLGKVADFFRENPIDAIGIAAFGPVDVHPQSPDYGMIGKTPKFAWQYVNLITELQKNLPVPIRLDTDVNAAALAESAAYGTENLAYVTVGTGLGAGAIVEGKLVHGLLHPEMGHIAIRRHPGDPFPGCCPYHADCLEGMASGTAMRARTGKSGKDLPADDDAWIYEADYLGQLAVTLLLTLSSEKIIFGGGVLQNDWLLPMIVEKAETQLNDYLLLPKPVGEIISKPALGTQSGLQGAFLLGRSLIE
ncbi:fructokinase [Sporosarcina sp. NCCP-2716]|uniref:ROK family protein n=1 Tax=Sporosarcina sp. NCCP-2716 TaxID=2943679 RepID=UPI00203F6FE6|nr:ROK family protein [Sporosarcina sp. NCCP-2716]GKV70148.1 fructokinase [Sporosarcina sp. NCCP-2716]